MHGNLLRKSADKIEPIRTVYHRDILNSNVGALEYSESNGAEQRRI